MRVPQLNAGDIDPVLDRGLNTDQYQAEPPWFNRTYGATLAATGSVEHRLLSDLLSRKVPDEEVFDLDADRWCVKNLAEEPSLAAINAKLRAELGSWREKTDNELGSEISRRTRRSDSVQTQ